MPIIEADEDEYKTATAAKSLLDKFANSPKTRQRLLHLIKEVNPDAVIPELDATAPVFHEIGELKSTLHSRLDQLEASLRAEKQHGEVNKLIDAERNKLRRQGWDDEGITKIEQTMQDRGFVDYEAAAALVKAQQPEPKPIGLDGGSYDRGWNFAAPADDDKENQAWLKNPRAAKNAEVAKFFQEQRAARR